ncbi:ankyrin repeat domain-containing protein 35 isoform X2 [Pseudophryne corroboree]|uniref:ankyrin repeat domain-containing protein 35 isoform X2 n=1 Tax=Pseudophryne corroboree TaxID=495146 RepID=UPI003081BCE1
MPSGSNFSYRVCCVCGTEPSISALDQRLAARQKRQEPYHEVDKWDKHDQKLLEAVEKGDAKKVTSLLSKKPIRATKTGPNGQSAFHLAASKGLVDCMSVIISHKVEINAKTDDGCTALHLASSNCHPECVKLLLQRGAHEDSIDFHSRTPLHCAATSGCVSSVLLLCNAEDTILDAVDDDGRTPLMIAALRNHPTVCSLLLDRGAELDHADREKKTALILACEKDNIQAAETLITKGADPRLKDSKGYDPLYYANLSRDGALKKLIQTALDRRKNEQSARSAENLSASKTPSKEHELVNIWKKRYDEEQKRGVWLQGELMMKTQELETLSNENSRIRELAGTLDGLLDDQTETPGAKAEEYHISDTCNLLTRVLEQVKSFQDRQAEERNLQEDKIKALNDRTTETEKLEERHREEMRHLQGQASAAREREESARRRVTELEGHLENMREVMSQFEKRKRIQSAVVEDLQEQISEVMCEKEELLVVLQKLQGKEEKAKTVHTKRLDNGQSLPDNHVLNELLKKLKSDCVNVEIRPGNEVSNRGSSYVPKEVLQKNVDYWKTTIPAIENYITNIERPKDNLATATSGNTDSGLGNSPTGKQNNGHITMRMSTKANLPVEANVPCLQNDLTYHTKSTTNQLNSIPSQVNEQDSSCAKNTEPSKQAELEAELSSLKVTHDKLLTQMDLVIQEKQNLEEGLLALQESMQSQFVMRQEMEIRCKDYKHQISALSDELLAEQEKLKKLNIRLEAQKEEMVMLQDSFPTEIIREESNRVVKTFSSDVLEELYWNVGTLVRKYNELTQQAAALQKKNQKLLDYQVQTISMTEHKNILNEIKNELHTKVRETEDLKQRLFQVMGSMVELKEQLAAQTSNSFSRQEVENSLADLERVVTALKEENEECQLALDGKCKEILVLKQQLEQEAEERQALRHKEANAKQEFERVRHGLDIQLQELREEVQELSVKYMETSKVADNCKGMLASERDKVKFLEEKVSTLTKEAEQLKIKSQKYEQEKCHLSEKCDHLSRTSQEKQEKMEESMKELESLTKVIDQHQRQCEELAGQLKDTNKRHEEIISVYRTHLLNAAQGYMDEDIHFALHWILKMQKELVY